MAWEAKNYDHLLGGKAKGLSDAQLKAHFSLYQGYVKKINEIWERLGKADRAAVNYSYGEYSELRRREPVAYNGAALHEMYFENLGDGSTQPGPEIKKALEASFGSLDNWMADVKACMATGHGWTLLAYDYDRKRLHNNLVQSEHHVGLLANTHVIAAFDAWEHAYFFDYQTKKADYVANVLAGLNWKAINERFAPIMQHGGK